MKYKNRYKVKTYTFLYLDKRRACIEALLSAAHEPDKPKIRWGFKLIRLKAD
jgi:hypothetical protein